MSGLTYKQQIKKVKEFIRKQKEDLERSEIFLNNLIQLQQNKCKHKKTWDKTNYYPPSYYDREYWKIETICNDCGKIINTIEKFGGFH